MRFPNLEGAVDFRVVGKSIVGAPDLVIDVLAELSCIRVTGVAHLQAEHAGADKVDPLSDLGVVLVTREVARLDEVLERTRVHSKAIGEHNATERISLLVSTMRVELN